MTSNVKAVPDFGSQLASQKREEERKLEIRYAVESMMGPPGTLNLPPLLEKARLKYELPDFMFVRQCVADRIYVFQPEEEVSDTFVEGGVIQKTEVQKVRERHETPRGLLISAGLLALDQLRSNGVDLGHTVTFIRNAPWRLKAGSVAGHPLFLLALRAGDIVSSDELAMALLGGEMRVEAVEDEHGVSEHRYMTRDGAAVVPRQMEVADDL